MAAAAAPSAAAKRPETLSKSGGRDAPSSCGKSETGSHVVASRPVWSRKIAAQCGASAGGPATKNFSTTSPLRRSTQSVESSACRKIGITSGPRNGAGSTRPPSSSSFAVALSTFIGPATACSESSSPTESSR